MRPAPRSRGLPIAASLVAAVFVATLQIGCSDGSTRGRGGGGGGDGVDPGRVAALGRIEPDQLVRVAGPARIAAVVDRLLVEEDSEVEEGDVLALLDSVGVEEAEVAARRAELEQAERSLERARSLSRQRVAAKADEDAARAERDLAASRLRQAESELERSRVRAPIAGRVLEIHALAGEKVGGDGILELADRDPMLAVAEVWETDVSRVRVGQRAVVRSPALPEGELHGTVRRIASRIGRRDVLDSDPVAAVDARVVEVDIELDTPSAAADRIHLQVDVEIDTSSTGDDSG